MSLKPVGARLAELLPGRTVKMAPDCIGAEVEAMLPAPGEVLLLENLRFHKEEEGNDPLDIEPEMQPDKRLTACGVILAILGFIGLVLGSVFTGGATIAGGQVRLPTGPGLGLARR